MATQGNMNISHRHLKEYANHKFWQLYKIKVVVT